MTLQHLRSSTANKRPLPAGMSDGQLAINTNLASPGVFFKDSNGDLVKAGPVHVGATAPNSSPASGGQTGNTKGEQWLDTSGTNPVLKVWDGAAWQSEAGEFVNASGDTMTGALVMDNQQQVRFRETTANGTNYIALQAPASVASDKTIILPDVTGTVVTTGDTGSVTSTMLADGTIVDADISGTAEIAVSKLQDGTARQLLQTDAAGTGVEWASNIDIPGTLDVTSTATFDSIASHPLGTNSAPTITFTGNTNTGIYSPGADQVAISTGGSGRLFINSNGDVGIGAAAGTARNFALSRDITGNPTARAYTSIGNIKSDVTNVAAYYSTFANTEAASFTLTNLRHYTAIQSSFGAGSTVTNQIGYVVESSLIGATNNYGFYGDIASGTGRYNFFANGTARNHFAGETSFIGSVGAPSCIITSAGSVGIGTTSPAFAVGEGLEIERDSVSATLRLQRINTGGSILEIRADDGKAVIDSRQASTDLAFQTNSAERARIDSSGRLLVGTSSALSNVQLGGNNFTPQVQWQGADANSSLFSLTRTTAFSPHFAFNSGSSGNNVASGVSVGTIVFNGFDGTNYVNAASINAAIDGTSGTGDMPGRLVFSTTADGASSPTEEWRITNDGVIAYNQVEPISKAAAATLTVAELKTGIIRYTGALATLTLPTGTLTEGGFSGIYTNLAFEWSVINTGSGTCTIGAGTGHTVIGSATIAAGASGRFASRRTAANTFVTYRLS